LFFNLHVKPLCKKGEKMKIKTIIVSLLLAVFLFGCSGMSTREQRVLSGGAIGAGSGAVIGAVTGGSVATGAVIGAGVGALGGLILDESKRR
jgi:membrane protein involved in colicin uptake